MSDEEIARLAKEVHRRIEEIATKAPPAITPSGKSAERPLGDTEFLLRAVAQILKHLSPPSSLPEEGSFKDL
jgi:hypothetical protein